jgi:phospholipid-binding lipoprotein MlaA
VRNIVILVAVFSLLLISCAHKKAGPPATVETDRTVSAKTDGAPDQGTDESVKKPVQQASETSEKPSRGAKEEQDDDLDDDFDDDFDDDEDEVAEIADPFFHLNKAIFHVNDKMYFWVLKPVGTVYKTILPEFVRIGIRNFFHNLSFPVRFVSCVLQGKGVRAQAELGRFMFNSTFGVLGFGNPAKQFDHLNPPKEDLGQTFGHWGVGEGFYMVLPVLGPSTIRDTVGLIGDFFLYPVTYLEDWEARLAFNATRVVNETSLRIGDYEAFKDAAIDPYASMRDGYIQDRRIDVVK